jgi:hypothetical protein
MDGWLVAYNTADEQLQVENYFTGEQTATYLYK